MTGSMALPSLMTTLIPWAISSVLLILAVLAGAVAHRDRLSSVNRYALWLVVLIRLLIPIQLPFLSSLGAGTLRPRWRIPRYMPSPPATWMRRSVISSISGKNRARTRS
ncbi:MAG: hypothetical protein ACLR0P_06210 [Oscillospiraceae bacterium]